MVDNNKYLHIMRGEKPPEYGVGVSNIIGMNRPKKGSKKMRCILYIDGEEFVFTDITVKTELSGTDYKIHIGTLGSEMPATTPPQEEMTNQPDVSGFVGPDTKQEQFFLQGDNLDTFVKLSPFRVVENQVDTPTKQVISATLETKLYNIMSMGDTVKNAAMELIEQEQELINQGFRVVKVEMPKFAFSADDPEQNTFKLVEVALLIKEPEETNVSNKKAGSTGSSETESAN